MRVYKFESYKDLNINLGKKKSPDFLGIYSYFNSLNQNNYLFFLFLFLSSIKASPLAASEPRPSEERIPASPVFGALSFSGALGASLSWFSGAWGFSKLSSSTVLASSLTSLTFSAFYTLF